MNENYRKNKILKIVPPDVVTVLDIGSRGDIFMDKYKTTTIDILEKSDIKQDLNKNQKLPLKSNSFDLVVMNQILEHLAYVEELIDESKRVSKKYIFIGLPNETTWGVRIRYLFGKIDQEGYIPYGHKHRFTIKTIESFVKKFYGDYEKKEYWFAATGAKILPNKLKDFLAERFPTLFAKEVYYLIKNKNEKNTISKSLYKKKQ